MNKYIRNGYSTKIKNKTKSITMKGRLPHAKKRGSTLTYGLCGFIFNKSMYVTTNHMKSIRNAINYYIDKDYKRIWTKVEEKNKTRKHKTRMGKGKGKLHVVGYNYAKNALMVQFIIKKNYNTTNMNLLNNTSKDLLENNKPIRTIKQTESNINNIRLLHSNLNRILKKFNFLSYVGI